MSDKTENSAAGKVEPVQPEETQPAGFFHRAKRFLGSASRAVMIVLLAGVAFWVGSLCGGGEVHDHDHDHASEPGRESAEQTVYTCPMHPQIRLTDPKAKCPICGMDLVPVEAGEKGDMGDVAELKMSARAQKLAQIETATVIRKSVEAETRVFGRMAYDERRVGYITSWVEGRIERLFVRFTGARVSRGQAMVRVYSPELVTAQMELVQASKLSRETRSGETLSDSVSDMAESSLRAARHKLSLMGLSAGQIARVEKSGKPSDNVTIHAPAGGVVIEKHAEDGMYVKPGTKLFTIADLSRLWVKLDVYESDLGRIRAGRKVTFSTEAYPGETFEGEVDFIDPFVNDRTRTVRVRLTVDNKDLRLKPDMFVRAVILSALDDEGNAIAEEKKLDAQPLVIPRSAPLVTGARAVVYIEKEPGVYQGREVVLGPRVGDYYLVREGLTEGEKVVTRGNFKIDSALQIMARPSMMSPAEPAEDLEHQQHHHGNDCPHHAHHQKVEERSEED